MFKKRGLMLITLVFTLLFSLSAYSFENLPFSQKNVEVQNKIKVENKDSEYFTIKSVKIRKVEEKKVVPRTGGTTPSIPNIGTGTSGTVSGVNQVVMTIDKIVALGKKIWDIFKEGRPVVTAKLTPISVIPKLEDSNAAFYEMTNWSIPTTEKYEVVYENLYGMDVVKFEFMVIFQHSGSYQGAGKYITGLNIIPSSVKVSWGFTFDLSSELVSISNMGSADEPLASATLQMKYVVKNVLREIDTSIIFHAIGDGRLIKL